MIAEIPLPSDVAVPHEKTKSHEDKKKRKIRFSLKKFRRHKKPDTQQTPQVESIGFASARQLHKDRGYHAFHFKEIMRKPKKHRNEHLIQASPEQLHPTPVSEHVMQQSEQVSTMQENFPTRQLHKIKEKGSVINHYAKETGEKIKWFLGELSRGNIVKRLQKIEQNPQAYAVELEAELARSMESVLTPEDPSFGKRNLKNILQGFATASTAFPAWFPTHLPFPFLVYTGGSIIVTINNIINTGIAFGQKRFRKAGAYSLMTLGGIATGFFPGAHNLTNTWYTELVQKSFDHTESDGMLRIIHSLSKNNASQDKRDLANTMFYNAVNDTYTKTGTLLASEDVLTTATTQRIAERDRLLARKDAIQKERAETPGFFKTLREPKHMWKRSVRYFQLFWDSINLHQELIDAENKVQTANHLQAIFVERNVNLPRSQQEISIS